MTTNGRGPSSQDDPEDAAKPEINEQRPSQAPSGVFRTSRERRRGGGWIIAEQFVREGFYYRLLRRPVADTDGLPRLTQREEAALELACVGHSNKSIAQVLDVSPSTVGVLLFRAAAKLNVGSRSDLLLAYEHHKTSFDPDDAEASDEPER